MTEAERIRETYSALGAVATTLRKLEKVVVELQRDLLNLRVVAFEAPKPPGPKKPAETARRISTAPKIRISRPLEPLPETPQHRPVWLRDMRIALGLSQSQLGAKIGKIQSQVSQIELGVARPSDEAWREIASTLERLANRVA